jgi:hypothetical protein
MPIKKAGANNTVAPRGAIIHVATGMPASTAFSYIMARANAGAYCRSKQMNRYNSMKYVPYIPRKIPPGKVLMHNHIMHGPDWEPGINGFRAWVDDKPPEGFVPERMDTPSTLTNERTFNNKQIRGRAS